MRIIAVTNQKGGVGKTTTTVNLAAALAREGQRVVLMDLDPQAHLTTFLGIDPEQEQANSHDVLTKSVPIAEAAIDIRDNMKVLTAGLDLAAAEQELVSVVGRETILRDAIEGYTEPCDYFLIDCPPSLGLLTLNALSAAREVFIPLQPHFLSLQGLSQLLETVLLVQRRINLQLQVTGLVFCMFDGRTSLAMEIVRDIESFLTQQRQTRSPWNNVTIFETRIRRNVKLAESPSHGQTIFEYELNCNGAEDYQNLAVEVAAMTGVPTFEQLGSDLSAGLKTGLGGDRQESGESAGAKGGDEQGACQETDKQGATDVADGSQSHEESSGEAVSGPSSESLSSGSEEQNKEPVPNRIQAVDSEKGASTHSFTPRGDQSPV